MWVGSGGRESHSASQARFLKGHGKVGRPGGVFSFPVGVMAAGKGTLDVAFMTPLFTYLWWELFKT